MIFQDFGIELSSDTPAATSVSTKFSTWQIDSKLFNAQAELVDLFCACWCFMEFE